MSKRKHRSRKANRVREAIAGLFDGETGAPLSANVEGAHDSCDRFGRAVPPASGFAKVDRAALEWKGSTAQSREVCYHGGAHSIIALPNGARLAGATFNNIALDLDVSLVIRACDTIGAFQSESDGINESEVVNAPEEYHDLKQYEARVPVIRIHWDDYGVPLLYPKFWLELAARLPLHGRTVCTCTGGHGRTGTMLACLIVAGDATWSADDAISYVRDNHCVRAVESLRQEAYVRAVERARDASLTQ